MVNISLAKIKAKFTGNVSILQGFVPNMSNMTNLVKDVFETK